MNITTLSNHSPLLSFPIPTHNLSLQCCHSLQNPFLFLNKSRKTTNRHSFGRSNKLLIHSAFIIASNLGVLPAPLDLILRDHFGNGSGSGSGSGSGFGFGWNGDGGGKRRRRRKGKIAFFVLVLVCLFVLGGKEIVLSCDVLLAGLCFFGGLGFGKDWVFGFLCCGFLGFVFKKDDFRSWVLSGLNVRKNGGRRRKMRIF